MPTENPGPGSERPSPAIALNLDQKLYVIATAGEYSCFGFDNARDHTNQRAEKLNRADLAFAENDYATLTGYCKYQEAVAAWSRSLLSQQTYFEPGTAVQAASVLESRRKTGSKVRLVLGNTQTGDPWLNEADVVGRIGRSVGSLKVPLLVEEASGGSAILTACLLQIIDWKTGRTLYRHPRYKEPDLELQAPGDSDLPYAVAPRNVTIAQFKDMGKACAYIAFMRGETIEPRIFR